MFWWQQRNNSTNNIVDNETPLSSHVNGTSSADSNLLIVNDQNSPQQQQYNSGKSYAFPPSLRRSHNTHIAETQATVLQQSEQQQQEQQLSQQQYPQLSSSHLYVNESNHHHHNNTTMTAAVTDDRRQSIVQNNNNEGFAFGEEENERARDRETGEGGRRGTSFLAGNNNKPNSNCNNYVDNCGANSGNNDNDDSSSVGHAENGNHVAGNRGGSAGRLADNAYLALEEVWRDMKQGNNSTTATVVPPRQSHHQFSQQSPSSAVSFASPRGISTTTAVSGKNYSSNNENETNVTAQSLNLSAICISNILMLEDRHLPSIFIKMYEFCLRQNERYPDDTDNNARLRLLNYLIQRWHETRDKLSFYRDTCKVLGALAKPLLGDHLSVAVEATPVNQQHVMRELMRSLRRDTRGRSLGVFLEQHFARGRDASSRTTDCFTFHDLALELFSREDVMDYENTYHNGGGSGIRAFVGDLASHPLSLYIRRLLLSITRALCRLKLNMPPSVSNRLFCDSVPSWAEEDTESGMINMDRESKARLDEARQNIARMLMHRRRDRQQQRRQPTTAATVFQENDSGGIAVNKSNRNSGNNNINNANNPDIDINNNGEMIVTRDRRSVDHYHNQQHHQQQQYRVQKKHKRKHATKKHRRCSSSDSISSSSSSSSSSSIPSASSSRATATAIIPVVTADDNNDDDNDNDTTTVTTDVPVVTGHHHTSSSSLRRSKAKTKLNIDDDGIGESSVAASATATITSAVAMNDDETRTVDTASFVGTLLDDNDSSSVVTSSIQDISSSVVSSKMYNRASSASLSTTKTANTANIAKESSVAAATAAIATEAEELDTVQVALRNTESHLRNLIDQKLTKGNNVTATVMSVGNNESNGRNVATISTVVTNSSSTTSSIGAAAVPSATQVVELADGTVASSTVDHSTDTTSIDVSADVTTTIAVNSNNIGTSRNVERRISGGSSEFDTSNLSPTAVTSISSATTIQQLTTVSALNHLDTDIRLLSETVGLEEEDEDIDDDDDEEAAVAITAATKEEKENEEDENNEYNDEDNEYDNYTTKKHRYAFIQNARLVNANNTTERGSQNRNTGIDVSAVSKTNNTGNRNDVASLLVEENDPLEMAFDELM